jgi:hypothetical protein
MTSLILFLVVASHAMMPNPKLTPGAVDTSVTQANIGETICKSGYTATVRAVTEDVRRKVAQKYGVPLADLAKDVEIDHFISLEIGGSNDIRNLWPQYYKGQAGYFGAREKDVVENWLHKQVCGGLLTLGQAQNAIYGWVGIYKTLKGL